MKIMQKSDNLWCVDRPRLEKSNIYQFIHTLCEEHNMNFSLDYEEIYHWSIQNNAEFWKTCLDASGLEYHGNYNDVLQGEIPNIKWFKGIKTNYARDALKHPDENIALYTKSEIRDFKQISYGELKNKVFHLANQLRSSGVQKGDRVASYLPNIEETTVAMLATAAIGAIWSSAAPEFGAQTVLDRFKQIQPKVLLLCDGYQFNGKKIDKEADNLLLLEYLESVDLCLLVNYLGLSANNYPKKVNPLILNFQTLNIENFQYELVDSDHPLWILYSSGTTGLPKAIVHSHLGIMLESWVVSYLHLDVQPNTRSFFYTTTGWMMWNFLHTHLLLGATITLYEGSPVYGGFSLLWDLTEQLKVNILGASPSYIQMLQQRNYIPKQHHDLSCLQTLIMTGSPLPDHSYTWIYENIKVDLYLSPLSGGTDICSAFIGPTLLKPVKTGKMQCRMLGHDIQVWDEAGQAILNDMGELICAKPLPCMPVGFWADDQNKKYYETYFSDFPNVWKHGDFLIIDHDGFCVIKGRSDATLNRHGVRIGTGEIYKVVESIAGIVDSLVVCCDFGDGKFYMPMFLQLDQSIELHDCLIQTIRDELKIQCSPRHVPDEFIIVNEIPYTLTEKKMEIPIRKILLGFDLAKTYSPDIMKNPTAMQFFIDFSKNIKI